MKPRKKIMKLDEVIETYFASDSDISSSCDSDNENENNCLNKENNFSTKLKSTLITTKQTNTVLGDKTNTFLNSNANKIKNSIAITTPKIDTKNTKFLDLKKFENKIHLKNLFDIISEYNDFELDKPNNDIIIVDETTDDDDDDELDLNDENSISYINNSSKLTKSPIITLTHAINAKSSIKTRKRKRRCLF